jgi:hypothetical protein
MGCQIAFCKCLERPVVSISPTEVIEAADIYAVSFGEVLVPWNPNH